mmetsp:Transcript_98128/g.194302  ORF Transcript_98128/g.194302 Transcript_98128/m.194302 type:complete len:160 (+) Transcript_98128:44-523(+)
MPSVLFSARKVAYGAAPFTNVRIGYNASAGCLNLLVPGARCGAIELMTGLKTAVPELRLDGTTCTIGNSQHLTVDFETENQVKAFMAAIKGESPTTPPTREVHLTKTNSAEVTEPAPSTPPRCGTGAASKQSMDIDDETPPRLAKRTKLSLAEVSDTKM